MKISINNKIWKYVAGMTGAGVIAAATVHFFARDKECDADKQNFENDERRITQSIERISETDESRKDNSKDIREESRETTVSKYDAEGYDRWGRDAEGYNRAGFARNGFNREGVDRQGYGYNRYNSQGTDRAGHDRQFYAECIEKLRERLEQAKYQLRYGEYRYAVYDTRVVMEEAIKMLLRHVGGDSMLGETLRDNLKTCEQKGLIDARCIDKLHDVRRICNANGHEFDADKTFTHDKVHFVIMEIKSLLGIVESATVLC